jgi:hypothetical protein
LSARFPGRAAPRSVSRSHFGKISQGNPQARLPFSISFPSITRVLRIVITAAQTSFCLLRPATRRPVGRQVEHGLSRPCSRPSRGVRQHRSSSRSLTQSSPVRLTSRSRTRRPDGPCIAFWADQQDDPFTLLCCSHVREQPAFVSACSGDGFPRARRHPRQDGDSFAPGASPLS